MLLGETQEPHDGQVLSIRFLETVSVNARRGGGLCSGEGGTLRTQGRRDVPGTSHTWGHENQGLRVATELGSARKARVWQRLVGADRDEVLCAVAAWQVLSFADESEPEGWRGTMGALRHEHPVCHLWAQQNTRPLHHGAAGQPRNAVRRSGSRGLAALQGPPERSEAAAEGLGPRQSRLMGLSPEARHWLWMGCLLVGGEAIL